MNKITLTNFKKFDHIVVEINQHGLTLISGVNNSGKTSILHALAVWEYAKILLVNHRGNSSILGDYNFDKQGLGIAPDSFSPISIPSLKYLWKDQRTIGSYILKIRVDWSDSEGNIRYLEIAYTLTGNNFAIKTISSNLVNTDSVPRIAYLPPFGGVNENESWLSVADRRKLIGKGQAGSVIRNLLHDLHLNHEKELIEKRNELFPDKIRLSREERQTLADIKTEWRYLKEILSDVFHVNLHVQKFDSHFHNYIKVDVFDLVKNPQTGLKEKKPTSKRDLMVEGSGFLQWLSVFTLALDKNNDVLLLDEPDAHLHTSLQALLLEKLEYICSDTNKQILMVSHSPDIIKFLNYNKILHVEDGCASYIKSDDDKVLVLEGLGSKYFPLFDSILEYKRILFVENKSDERLLKIMFDALEIDWPNNIVVWPTTKSHQDRKILAIEINQKIMQITGEPIKSYSLRDLDDDNYSTTDINLHYNGKDAQKDDSGLHDIMYYRNIRRRDIENYMIIPSAISRYISSNCRNPEIPKDVDSVNEYLQHVHGLIVPECYRDSDRIPLSEALFVKDVKPILNGINRYFRVKFDLEGYYKSIERDEIPDDIIKIVNEIRGMCL